MRLTRLALRHYGPFAEAALDLSAEPGCVNLVVAPNGAGKSVLRAAFGDLLFGIGMQTPMGFRHGYGGMQVSAEGVAPDGRRFAFTRRKGKGAGPLLGPDGAPLDPGLLPGLLGGADRPLLERLFALDTALLRAGGAGLLASGGALAEALLQAAGGLRPAQRLGQELLAARDRLAPPRKSAQRPFYEALDRLKSARDALRGNLLRPAQWRERERALEEAARRLEEARAGAARAAATLRRLERVRRLAPALRRHDAAAAWLAENAHAPLLPADLAGRIQAASEQAARAASGAGEAARQHQALAADAAALAPSAPWLERAGRIAALREAAGAAARAREALPALARELRDTERLVEDRLHGLGFAGEAGGGVAGAAALVPPPGLLEKARRLTGEHAPLAEAEREAPRRLERLRAACREAEAALAALPPARDAAALEALEALLAASRAGGEPAARLAEARRAVAEAESAWAGRAARLPAAWRAAGALRALAPPGAALLERRAAALRAAEMALRDAGAEEARAGAALAGSRERLAALEQGGCLPGAAALAEARGRRDAAWHRLREQGWKAAEAEAYRLLVAEADHVADLRFAGAGRLREADMLAETVARQQAAWDEARRAASAARGALEAARQGWAALLAPLGLDAGTAPEELPALFAAREEALDAAAACERARAALAERAERQAADARRLAALLGDPAAAGAPDGTALPVLLDRAGAVLREARASATERALRRQAALDRREELAEAERDALERTRRLEGWRAEWGAVLAALRRPAEEGPAEGAAALELLGQLGPLLRQAEALAERHGAATAELAAFTAEAAGLCAELGEAAPADPVLASRHLATRLEEEQSCLARRDALRQQAEAAARAAAAQEREAAARREELGAAIAAAGAGMLEEAVRRLALAAERERREAAREAALAEILEGQDGTGQDWTGQNGLDLAALRAEQAAHPPEALEAALEAAREAGAAAQRAAEGAAEDRARAEAELQRLGADGAAQAAAAEEQAALARIGQVLEEAVLLQAARSLLGAAMEGVQEAGDDARLRRIGAVFAALTEGAYPALAAREDEKGVAHLLARRAAPEGEETGVEALSEGTRDQLFLALRLVAIEDHVAAATPLPFLGDDILQSFDDGRAAAALRALRAFSRTTQVILLTHHRHLAVLAGQALPAGALHVRALPG
ncbi:AAA family ATPase [Teichococcus rhizosphaerae]|nr:AAA family ATPase [Pseudoroseomonas rhizosphaerae]